MKVLLANVGAECNAHISHVATLEDFRILYGEDAIDAMHVRDIFEEANIEMIPAVCAALPPNGMVHYDAFQYLSDTILNTIREHLTEIDAIYLQLHGASGVVGLDCVSAEHYVLKEIRKIVGNHMPIAMVMDPHGNVTKELVGYLNICRCYRQSPHIDTVDTQRIVARKLVNLMQNRRPMHPIIKKLPIMVGGERSVSAQEPMRSINEMMDEFEKDERIFSISYHVGYIRHDDDKLGAAVVVVPNTPKDAEYCDEVAVKVSEYAWQHRHEFHFTGNYDEPDLAVQRALSEGKKTTVITDSGDNCGAGGAGQNTIMLKELLKVKTDRSILIAGINDKKAHAFLSTKQKGDFVRFDLGIGEDENSMPVAIAGTIVQIGEQKYGNEKSPSVGKAFIVRVENTNLDVLVMDHNVQYGTMQQFHAAGVEFHDYDIVVVKMGYLDTYLIPETSYHIMALTDGPTIQRSEQIPFKKIYRPMWPLDEMEELEYIEK